MLGEQQRIIDWNAEMLRHLFCLLGPMANAATSNASEDFLRRLNSATCGNSQNMFRPCAAVLARWHIQLFIVRGITC